MFHTKFLEAGERTKFTRFSWESIDVTSGNCAGHPYCQTNHTDQSHLGLRRRSGRSIGFLLAILLTETRVGNKSAPTHHPPVQATQ